MINRKNTAAGPEKLLSKALKLLSYRPRSIAEIRRRLERLSDSRAQIEATLKPLIEDKFLDDLAFARWWVEQRIEFRPRGNQALRAELFQKGVDREIVERVLLTKEQELKLAKKVLAKKNPDKVHAQRLLLSRGFSPDVVYQLT